MFRLAGGVSAGGHMVDDYVDGRCDEDILYVLDDEVSNCSMKKL